MLRNAIKVKICGMRDSDNIQAVMKLKPEYLGFIFYPKSKRYVGDELDAALLRTIPKSTQKVGVFVDETIENVKLAISRYHLDFVQLHGDESPDYCRKLMRFGKAKVMKVFRVDEEFDFVQTAFYQNVCDFYLFDAKGKDYGGNGIKFNWDILSRYQGYKSFFLSGGISLDDKDQIQRIRDKRVVAVDVNSGFEIRPGVKDTSKLRQFLS